MAGGWLWLPESSIVYHRRSQGDAKRAIPLQISSLSCCLFFKRRYPKADAVARLKATIFGPSQTLAALLLCVVCGSNFSLIKVQSTSEIVYEAFNFRLKLLSVLSKQLA